MPVKIRVRNFQSIKDSSLEVKGLTAITGPNNAGKTALMRAIRGVFQNTPGTSFVRHGTEECQVDLDFQEPDGSRRSITWKKGTSKKSRPCYVIDGADPIFPGKEVPEEVQSFNVLPIQAGREEVWPTLAPQFTGQVFLLDRPGSALAEAVSDVEKVAKLNNALRASESDRKQAQAALRLRHDDEVRQQADVDRYEGLDLALALVTEAERLQAYASKVGKALESLRVLKVRMDEARAEVERLSPVEAIVLPENNRARDVLAMMVWVQSVRSRLCDANDLVSRLAGVEALEAVLVSPAQAQEILNTMAQVRQLENTLVRARQEVVSFERESTQMGSGLLEAESELAEALADFPECPVCGSHTPGHAHGGDL